MNAEEARLLKKNLKGGRAMFAVQSDDFLLMQAVKLRQILKLAYLDSSCFGDCQVIPRLGIFYSFGSTLKHLFILTYLLMGKINSAVLSVAAKSLSSF